MSIDASLAVPEQAALIPLAYGRATAYLKQWVMGWWEFGKTDALYADLVVSEDSPRPRS